MTRYLTAWAFNTRKRSFMSLFIMSRLSFESGGEGVGGFTCIPDSRETFTYRETLPVAISLGLLLLRISHPADCFIHEVALFSFRRIPGLKIETWGIHNLGLVRARSPTAAAMARR